MAEEPKIGPEGGTPRNISTEHQGKGDARNMSDTLDRPAEKVHPAREFNPGSDAGNPEPGKPAE